ncbi:hypothetical protein ACIBL3_45750 [Kribbella sp. NPDC050124]|uniref:hypothetical protein n=1 Tax=Kribbella sp. NPDC050124 TaxID=3364114 RepID=UPI00378D66CA
MTTTALEDRELTPPRTRKYGLGAVLVAVGIPAFIVSLDNLVVTNVLPVIKHGLGASLADLQWFVNADSDSGTAAPSSNPGSNPTSAPANGVLTKTSDVPVGGG